jgi:hypothetical protein
MEHNKFTCECGVIISTTNCFNNRIKLHLNSQLHKNILKNPKQYYNCKICNQPYWKYNKKGIKRHEESHKLKMGVEFCYLNGEQITKETFDKLIDSYYIDKKPF